MKYKIMKYFQGKSRAVLAGVDTLHYSVCSMFAEKSRD
jgi:hypothetical protein